MDDDLSDLFLLNDCLISGRLSPGPPDDFLAQTSPTSLLPSHCRDSDGSNFFYCNYETNFGYSADSLRRYSSDETAPINQLKRDNVTVSGQRGITTPTVFAEEHSSTSSGRSPDHDYVNDVKVELVLDHCENGTSCGDPTFSVNDILVAGDATDVIRTSANFRLTDANETSRNGLVEKSGILAEDVWPSNLVVPKDEDGVPLADDNSSTSSGDSCSSNCGYFSATSPAPSYHRGRRLASASPYPTSNLNRYRAVNHPTIAGVNLNIRGRSKMHELAVRHNLISEQDPRNKGYVLLSVEERRTLIQEGLPVPTKLPLSKQEEEALKIVRRKIKNKLSAQESRRKRKEYMETLEQQIEGYQSENVSLRKRIDTLEKTNQSLLGQLRKLQQQFTSGSSSTSAQSGDRRETGEGGSNVHHTVSLAAIFVLFAIMIPAMPVWPSVFQSAFVTSPFSLAMSKHSEHSNSPFDFSGYRVLSSNSNGDCEIPHGGEYFEILRESRDGDDHSKSEIDLIDEDEQTRRVSQQNGTGNADQATTTVEIRNAPAHRSHVPSTAISEKGGCLEAMAVR